MTKAKAVRQPRGDDNEETKTQETQPELAPAVSTESEMSTGSIQELIESLTNSQRAIVQQLAKLTAGTSNNTSDPNQHSTRKFSTKNIRLEKFDPDHKLYLIDSGIKRWLERFDSELEFELKEQQIRLPNDELKKVVLFRFLKGRAQDYTTESSREFKAMTYEQVKTHLTNYFTRHLSQAKKNGMIQWTKRRENELADSYMGRLVTIADSMPEGRAFYEDLVLDTFVDRADPRFAGAMHFELEKLEGKTFDEKRNAMIRMLEAYTINDRRKKNEDKPNNKRPHQTGNAFQANKRPKKDYRDFTCWFESNGVKCEGKGHSAKYHRMYFSDVPKLTSEMIAKRKEELKREREQKPFAKNVTNVTPQAEQNPSSESEQEQDIDIRVDDDSDVEIP